MEDLTAAKQAVQELVNAAKNGGVDAAKVSELPADQQLEVMKQAANAQLAAACAECDAAGIANDPAALARALDFERVAMDSTSGADQSIMVAALNSIAMFRARAQAEQQAAEAIATQQTQVKSDAGADQDRNPIAVVGPKTQDVADERAQPNKGSGRGAA